MLSDIAFLQRPSVGVGESSEITVGDWRRAVALGVAGSVGTLVLVVTLVLVGMLVGACVGVGDSSEIVV